MGGDTSGKTELVGGKSLKVVWVTDVEPMKISEGPPV